MKTRLLALLLCLGFTSMFTLAQEAGPPEEKPKPWKDTLDLSVVLSGGNTEAETWSLKNLYTYQWPRTQFKASAFAVRKELTEDNFTGLLQDDGSVIVEENSDTETLEEKYDVELTLEQQITGSWFWDVHAGWERDRFSGIDNRVDIHLGLGRYFVKTENRVFKATLAAGYTDEDPVVEDPAHDDGFSGFRAAYDWLIKFKPRGQFTQNFQASTNNDESDDLRMQLDTSVVNQFTRHIGLKAGLLMKYDNNPSLIPVSVFDGAGTQVDTIEVESDELDTVLTMSLSIAF
ncbi:DUF481 domain-containing protein [Sulfidibacter corallicola]|uniref:DUF481 domain-containing protein n=1 Tax=Sulfidibacter corallicola TaxID=2818388 RepID=A0A8A4TL07_SULCO|nr:DUF481 domain-containing protein [Sulfidibacter corallicola]QTD49538.1 DUF481 domain-containing protein [Sulfidibacter corallicola]